MQKDAQLMSGLGISARDNEISQQIQSASDRETSTLNSLSGIDFDRTYLDGQISYYRMVVDTMDRDLLPNARDPQVRASLQNARERANEHLREAQDLRNSLAMPGATR
jgi:putative membrane protein